MLKNAFERRIKQLREEVRDYNKKLSEGIAVKDYFATGFDDKGFLVAQDSQPQEQVWVEVVPEWASYQMEFDALDGAETLDLALEYYHMMGESEPDSIFTVPLAVKINRYGYATNSVDEISESDVIEEYFKDFA